MLLPILALAVLVPDCVQAAVSSSGGCPSVQGKVNTNQSKLTTGKKKF